MGDGGDTTEPGTKAGRNERRKILGTFLNTIGAAALLLGLLQPGLLVLSGVRVISGGELVAGLVFTVVGVTLHAVAQVVVSRLED
jgi:hypothetical protein